MFFDVVPFGAPFMDRGKVPHCLGTGTKFISVSKSAILSSQASIFVDFYLLRFLKAFARSILLSLAFFDANGDIPMQHIWTKAIQV